MYEYGKIAVDFWADPDMRRQDITTKLVFAYLLTCRHRNAVGYYYLPLAYVAADMGITPDMASVSLERLIGEGFVCYDYEAEVVLLPKYLKHNKLANENCTKAAVSQMKKLPPNKLASILLEYLENSNIDVGHGKERVVAAIKGRMAAWEDAKPVISRSSEPFRNRSDTVPEPFPNRSGTVAEHIDIDVDIDRDIDIEYKEDTSDDVLTMDTVVMTKDQYASLCEKLGKSRVDDLIFQLQNYSHIKPKEFAKYKSHYHVVLNWDRMRKGKPHGGKWAGAPSDRVAPPKDLLDDITGGSKRKRGS